MNGRTSEPTFLKETHPSMNSEQTFEIRVSVRLAEYDPMPRGGLLRFLTGFDRWLRLRLARKALAFSRQRGGVNGMRDVMARRLLQRFILSPDIAASMARLIIWEAPQPDRAVGRLESLAARRIEASRDELSGVFTRAVEEVRLIPRSLEALKDLRVGGDLWASARVAEAHIRDELLDLVGHDAEVLEIELARPGPGAPEATDPDDKPPLG